ncbi:MAG: hypothetical protein L3J84_02155 [Gammaproteobacteria bacterium]|nr:hypothetical protein [Gammaproteobacteria bacterium]
MGKKRARSVTLDSAQVQGKAKALGIYSQTALNDVILKNRENINGSTTKVGDRAWNDIPMERKSAVEVARALCVTDYHLLLNVSSSSLWSQLLYQEENRKEILDIVLKSETDRRHLFTLGKEEKSDVWKIKKDDGWCLKFNYKPGYYLLALIRDKSKHVVITPSHYDFPRNFKTDVVTIPDTGQWLYFDPKEKSDWREIIVIACRENIFPVISEKDDNDLSSTARECIATKLLGPPLKDDYVIDSIAFELIDSNHA